MKCDVLLYTVGSGAVVTPGNNVPIGAVVRRKGCGISVIGDTLKISQRGFYEVTVSATMTASVAGDVTVSANFNGAPIAGATATETFTTADTENRSISFTAVIKSECPCDGGISFTVSGTPDVTFSNFAVEVVSV